MRKALFIQTFILLLSLIAVAVSAWLSSAAEIRKDTTFSWLPNTEKTVTGYEVYCDKTPKPAHHSMWRSAPKDNIDGGRVIYTWDDFPRGIDHYCVVVAVGRWKGKKITSPFSKEVKVPRIEVAPVYTAPADVKIINLNLASGGKTLTINVP